MVCNTRVPCLEQKHQRKRVACVTVSSSYNFNISNILSSISNKKDSHSGDSKISSGDIDDDDGEMSSVVGLAEVVFVVVANARNAEKITRDEDAELEKNFIFDFVLRVGLSFTVADWSCFLFLFLCFCCFWI